MQGGFNIDMGMYTPSLSMLNEDLNYYGLPSINSKTYFDLGFTMIDKYSQQKTLFAFAYWAGVSSAPILTENLYLYMFQISPQWELTSLSNAILPSGNLRINLGFTMRDVVASIVDEYSDDIYISYIGLIMDFGPNIGLEYYPIRNSRNFSISANLDYIFFNWNILPLEVFDYSSDLTGINVGDILKNHKGQDMKVDTNGLIFRFGVNFYY